MDGTGFLIFEGLYLRSRDTPSASQARQLPQRGSQGRGALIKESATLLTKDNNILYLMSLKYLPSCTFYWTQSILYYCHQETERLMAMFSMRYVHGHVMVYDRNGKFLFSADTEREAREELEEYEEYSA